MATKKRSESVIVAEIEAAVKEHHESKYDLTLGQLAELRNKIKALRAELQAVLSDGAEPCPQCGNLPLIIHQPKFYEARCLTVGCEERHSKGPFAETAVSAWNAGEYFVRPGQAGK